MVPAFSFFTVLPEVLNVYPFFLVSKNANFQLKNEQNIKLISINI